MNALRRMLLVAIGWAIFHGQVQFKVLVAESKGIQPAWFLLIFFMATLASSLLEEFEQTLKTWVMSVVFSVILVLLLVTLPIAFGALASEFAPLIIMGSIQPMVVALLLTAPINLLGCFLGQVVRNKVI